MAGMFVLLVVVLFSTRFRTYGIDQFYILYGGAGFMYLISRWTRRASLDQTVE